MKKRLLLFLLGIFILVGCSAKSTDEENSATKQENPEAQTGQLEPETVFSMEFSEDYTVDIWEINSSDTGDSLQFEPKTYFERDEEFFEYVVFNENGGIDARELSPQEKWKKTAAQLFYHLMANTYSWNV